MRRFILPFVVFLCGFVVMVLELVGARLLAPYLGTSLYVWTSIIGVILGSLSLGYWAGGKLADRAASLNRLATIIFLAGICIAVIAVYQTAILSLLTSLGLDLRLAAVIASLLLFAAPSVLLGMVSPYAVRLELKTIADSGATVGKFSAISTVGSIAGTFATGFWLLGYLGHTRILVFLAILLIGLSAFLEISRRGLKIILMIGLVTGGIAASFITSNTVVADVDSAYNRLLVLRQTDPVTQRPILGLTSAVGSFQSAMFLDHDDDLVFKYSKFYRLADWFNPRIQTALLIGGGAYSYPKDFLAKHATSTMDVIELDPAVTALADRYFNLPHDPRLKIYHQDARVWLNQNEGKYDAIFGDSFKSYFDVPYDLTTLEATQSISDHLTDQGVYLVNIISSLSGSKSYFFQAEYATFQKVFPQVLVFPVHPEFGPTAVQNIMLVGLKSPIPLVFKSSNPEVQTYLDHRLVNPPVPTLPPLTDDYAPVENYVAELLK